MLTLERLFTVGVRHAYFGDGPARGLRFIPADGARSFLEARGVLTRMNGGGLALHAEGGRMKALWGERLDGDNPRLLEFRVLSADPLAQIYTAEAPGLPVFGPGAAADGTLEPSGHLPRAQDGEGLPLALLRLPLVPAGTERFEDWGSSPAPSYSLFLEARKTLWKYLLLGDWRGREPRVYDPSGAVAFGDPETVTLDNGATALALRSLGRIPLRERPAQRLQLRDASATPARVLIKRLPAAAAGRFHRETVDGSPEFISEIFIHR